MLSTRTARGFHRVLYIHIYIYYMSHNIYIYIYIYICVCVSVRRPLVFGGFYGAGFHRIEGSRVFFFGRLGTQAFGPYLLTASTLAKAQTLHKPLNP